MEELIATLLITSIVVILLALIVGIPMTIIDNVTETEIEEAHFECVVTDKDVRHNQCKMFVTCNKFSTTINVTAEVYNRYENGDTVIVTRTGTHSIFFGDKFNYEVE